jgi:hypothetical protein
MNIVNNSVERDRKRDESNLIKFQISRLHSIGGRCLKCEYGALVA